MIFKFITKDIWRLDFSEFGKARRRAIRYLKALIITFKGFSGQRIAREAVALSYFGLMALVPIAALILFVASGFRLDKMLSDLLYASFPTNTQVIDAILNFANNILITTKKGTFGWISFGAFVWLVIWLLINIEAAFNRIWMVKKKSGIGKRILVYIAILLLSPFLMILFLYGWGYYIRFLTSVSENLGAFSFITTNLFWVIFYGAAVLIFSLLYKLIPHTKVRYGSALKGAIVSGLAFVAIQYLYLNTQLMVTRLSGVYGALAAIPLLMIWLNLCWSIILFGAQLSYGFQQVDYEHPVNPLPIEESDEKQIIIEHNIKQKYHGKEIH
ncbi:MAG: YihY/virulence factor BrkB family protein [Bacteroidales bacterium]|nr:YihY/virulence factor BrkB family protein [Bacteroidales bacterium]